MNAQTQDVVREFPAIGKHRVRLLKRRDDSTYLDIREYIQAKTFEGFTRRGVQITSHEDAESLRATIDEIMESKLL